MVRSRSGGPQAQRAGSHAMDEGTQLQPEIGKQHAQRFGMCRNGTDEKYAAWQGGGTSAELIAIGHCGRQLLRQLWCAGRRACPHRAVGRPATQALRGIQDGVATARSEEHTSELQSRENLVCRLLLEKKNAVGDE